jgi:thiol-disulfide isomerase/thioredoxin
MMSSVRPLALAALGAALLSPTLPAQAPPTTATPPPLPIMMKGDVLDPIHTRGLNDVDYTVDFPKNGPTTVVMFFLSTCPHCQAMLPHWNEAFEKKHKDLKVVGIMLDRAPGR